MQAGRLQRYQCRNDLPSRVALSINQITAGHAKEFHEKLTAKLLERLNEEGSARAKAQNPGLHMGSLTEIADLPIYREPHRSELGLLNHRRCNSNEKDLWGETRHKSLVKTSSVGFIRSNKEKVCDAFGHG